jgi:hypothetical protein
MYGTLRQEKIAANFRALSGLLQEACGVDLATVTPDVLLPPRAGPVTRQAAAVCATPASLSSSAARKNPAKSSSKRLICEDSGENVTLRPRNEKVR